MTNKILYIGIIFLIISGFGVFAAKAQTDDMVQFKTTQTSNYAHVPTDDEMSEIKVAIATNGVRIDNMGEQLNRVQNALEKIFFICLASILAALLGGGGIGFVVGKRKNGSI